MTSKITLVASEVLINDLVYNGTGSNSHPTFSWEAVTEVRVEDGLIFLITGDVNGIHGEFWFEADEQIVVIRHPTISTATTPTSTVKAGKKH